MEIAGGAERLEALEAYPIRGRCQRVRGRLPIHAIHGEDRASLTRSQIQLIPRENALVVQPPLQKQFSGFVVGHSNLLKARMKITTYNDHRSALFFRALLVEQLPSPLG